MFHFAGLADKMWDDKMITFVQKTWKEMTPAAQARALAHSCGPTERAPAPRVFQAAANPGPSLSTAPARSATITASTS